MKSLVAISAVFVLLFVVVCPLTPTPTAVVSGKTQQAPQMHVLALPMMFAVKSPPLSQLIISQFQDQAERLVSADVLELTCTRLC
jgi:hypothetical protein